jgi:hypothetical protein
LGELSINAKNIVTCIPIARQGAGKHIPACDNRRTSVARQRTSKDALLTIEDGVLRGARAEGL